MNESESEKLRLENDRLRRIIEAHEKAIARLKETIRNAKDITPIKRISFSRVRRLARLACLELSRIGKKLVVSMGDVKREFRSLRDIWEFLSAEDWLLSDLFPQLDPEPAKPKGKPCKFCFNPIFWLPNQWGKWFPHDIESGCRHRCEKFALYRDRPQTSHGAELFPLDDKMAIAPF